MGPMELADYVGLDTTKFIIDGMYIGCFYARDVKVVYTHLTPQTLKSSSIKGIKLDDETE